MSKAKGDGDETPQDEDALEKIKARAHSEKEEQAFKRTHDAIERSREARVKAQEERKGKDK